ncbi:DUF1546-domain-containing protein [Choiromyces venosus 120613-1]|uniref:TBP-associated factor 6 n=1 Tax=Choiromyces venosus 120613-1 TaxID=1336337 RepID=A0A3N4JVH6_9PEZI|nr:DUF1546-domain-containing protein [Choiromyces venosus 120613-1]
MSLWNGDTIKDVSESVGVANLSEDVAKNLAMDVEYRIHQVLQEALKFMHHAKRTTLGTQDISNALRVLDVEPLYGYESTRPLRFGEASLGQAQPIFYVEDDEVDFEKLINAPLPKVPRDVTFTGHWLAVEGVQPAIPQNPTPSEAARLSETTPKGASSNTTLSAASTLNPTTNETVTIKPLVKHVLSKELQLYFERISTSITDESTTDTIRNAALASLRNDPGLHQLLPYFVQFISEKTTHGLRNLFTLTQMMSLTHALLENESFFIEPYVSSLIPPILTCLIGKHLGSITSSTSSDPHSQTPAHYALRDLSASLLKLICKRFGDSSHTLKPRLTRTCLKHFLDPAKPLPTHYGSIIGLAAIGGREAVRVLILPNTKLYETVIRPEIEDDGARKNEAEMCLRALVGVIKLLEEEEEKEEGAAGGNAKGKGKNGVTPTTPGATAEEVKAKLISILGELVGEEVWRLRREGLVKAVVEAGGMKV